MTWSPSSASGAGASRTRYRELVRVGLGRLVRYDSVPVPQYLWPLIVAVLMFLTWQPVLLSPASGLDPSWAGGLAMTAHQGLSYGSQAIFTYGPLGFLYDANGFWFTGLGMVSFVFVLLSRAAGLGALFFGARQTFGSVESFVLAFVVASLNAGAAESAFVMVLLAWMLRRQPSARTMYIVAGLLGAVVGIEVQTKVSVGVAVLLMSAVALLVQPVQRWRVLATGVATAIVVFLATWLAAGGSLGAIPAYIHGSAESSLGYGAAMSTENPVVDWVYVPVLLMLFAGVWAAWDSTAGRERLQRGGLILVWVLFWWLTFKEGVREDAGHFIAVCETMLVGWFGFRWSRDARTRLFAGILVLGVSVLALMGVSLTAAIDPSRSVSAAVNDTRVAFNAGDNRDAQAAGRTAIMAADHLDPSLLAALRGESVAVFPYEIAAAWAYRLRWDPMPDFQTYAAYTPYLDRLNARFLANPSKAPARILDEAAGTIDGRYLPYDQPEATRTMLCRYLPTKALQAATSTSAAWLVLAREPDRCSAPHLIRVDSVGWDQTTPVPAPPNAHSFVFVRISGVQVHGLESLESLFFKPAQRSIDISGNSYRLIEANASDGLLLRSGSDFDYPAPFNLVPQAATLAVGKEGQPASVKKTITYRFYAVNYRPY